LSQTLWARTDRRGHRLQFRADLTDRMPAAVAEALITHEVAHVHGYATLGEAAWTRFAEKDARAVVYSWGQDPQILDRWNPPVTYCERREYDVS
jgi:hypothetical protein